MNMQAAQTPVIALIDIGNTRMKLGWLQPVGGKREAVSLAVEHMQLQRILPWLRSQTVYPVAAIGVNVAGSEKAAAVERLLQDNFGIPVQWCSSQRQASGVYNRYSTAGQLGADRWLSMIGLSEFLPENPHPRLLASFGTATTLDTLCPATLWPCTGNADSPASDIRWIYDGGLIVPGPALMRSSLAANTAQLPQAQGPAVAFPIDTHQAISSGIAAAQAGALLRQWQAGLDRYGVAPRVYCTGGGWPTVASEVAAELARAYELQGIPSQEITYLPAPILDGLARLASGMPLPARR